MENLIKELKEIYPDTRFIESIRDGHKVLLYDNETLEWDNEFISKVIELAKNNLDEKDLSNFTFLYDYLDEISSDLAETTFGINYIKSNVESNEFIK